MKRSFIFLLLIGVPTFCFTQNLKFKPTIGINTNIQNAPGTSNKKSKIGFDIGLLTERDLKHNLSFEFGFLLSKSIFSLDNIVYTFGAGYPILPYKENDTYKLIFLKIPMLINIKFHKKNPFAIGLGLVAKTKLSNKNKGYSLANPDFVYSDNFEFGTSNDGAFGLGFQTSIKKEFKFSNKNFVAGVYYDSDLTNWEKYRKVLDPPVYQGFTTKANNFSILFSMAL